MANPITVGELNGVFNNTPFPFDWSGRLVGGATRPDAMARTNPALLTAMQRMILAAPAGISENLGLTSAYRSPERQAELYAAAVAKGTHRTPGHQVAPPGRSRHNHGEAVDMAWASGGYRNAPREAVDWVYRNADNFGLTLPVPGETWHVELANGRRGAQPPAPGGRDSGGTVMAAGSQPQGLLGRLFASTQGAPAGAAAPRTLMQRTIGDQDWRMRLGATLDGMTLNPNAALQANVASRLKDNADTRAKNKTAEWLAAQGRTDLAEAVASGAMTGSEAAQVFYKPPEQPDTTALMQNVEYLMGQGMTLDEAIKATQGSAPTTVFNNRTDPPPPPGYRNVYNPDSTLSHQEPIPGGPAASALAAEETKRQADEKAAEAEAARVAALGGKSDQYANATINAIDTLIGNKDAGVPGMLDKNGPFDILPDAGIVGGALGALGINQETTNIALTLDTVKASVAFDRLQLMRDMSATGGALGSVTERELALLQSALGTLDQRLDPAILRTNLQYIRDTMAKIEKDPIARQVYYGGANGAAGGAGDGFSVVN